MRRRTILSLFAAAGLSACAHEAAPVAEATPADMGWSLTSTDVEGAKLAYGQPHSDNVLLMLTCQPSSGEVRLSMTAPQGSGAKGLQISSGGRTSKLPGEVAPGMGDGLIVEAGARADDPVLANFARSGRLAVAVGARRTELPAADSAQTRRFVESCGGA